MKKFLSLMVAIVMAIPAFASSNCMNYQAVVNNADGTPAADKNIGMKFTISSGTNTLFEETATVLSDEKGFVKYAIGSNTPDGLASVDWSNPDIMLQVGIDLAGGSDYTSIYSTQILSVPTALFSSTSLRSIETEQMLMATECKIDYEIESIRENLQNMETVVDKLEYENDEIRYEVIGNLDDLRAHIDALEVMTEEYRYRMDYNEAKLDNIEEEFDSATQYFQDMIANLQAQIEELKNK